MTLECGSLQDRMPAVAAGRAGWTAEDASNVETCADYGAEWRLVQAARRLGRPAEARLRQDVLTRAVLAGVHARQRRARWTRLGWVGGLAAAAALVLMVTQRRGPSPEEVASPAPMVAAGFHLPLAELDQADTEVLEAVLDQLDAPVSEGSSMDAPSLGDLDDTQLERVLRSLEG